MIKKWTVILIPHNRGERRSFNMSDMHIWLSAATMLVLLFVAAFFFQRSRSLETRAQRVELEARALEVMLQSKVSAPVQEADWSERELELRAEYEQRDTVLVRELSRLYDLEKEVRIITGLPAQMSDDEEVPLPPREGKGGRVGNFDDGIVYTVSEAFFPPEILNGIAAPSADIMLQEIQVRRESLKHMLLSMDAQRTRIAHTPSIWPTTDPRRRINSRFGQRPDPFTRRLTKHNGVDIAADHGSPIVVSADGVVTFSGYHQFLGNVVKIDHSYGLESWYGHMSTRLVETGDTLTRGQLIGKVGSTGRATGPHIHYEVHVNGKTVDPKNYIGH
ncbi:MAG: M23 family metallopeptidase [Candidatus Hydrogenedentota bacterium]